MRAILGDEDCCAMEETCVPSYLSRHRPPTTMKRRIVLTGFRIIVAVCLAKGRSNQFLRIKVVSGIYIPISKDRICMVATD